MASSNLSSTKGKPNGFTTLLSLAACEWFLMSLLFVDAALSYFLTKFAQYCELDIPCLLCSRFEFGFGRKEPGFYWNLLCRNHREEISSFVSCSSHGKFYDVKGMCEDCMAPPIAMQNRYESESYRMPVARVNVDRSVVQNMMQNKNTQLGYPDCRTCSCCDRSGKAKPKADRLLDLNPVVGAASKANLRPPLPRAQGRSRFNRRECMKRLRDKFSGSKKCGNNDDDSLNRVRSSKRRLSVHSDSEVLHSEDEDAKVRACETYSEPDRDIQCDDNNLHEAVTLHASEKQAHQDCEVKPLILHQHNLFDLSKNKTAGSLSSDSLIENGSRDLNWEETYNMHPPSLGDGSTGVPTETVKSNISIPQTPILSGLSELLPLSNGPALNNAITKVNVGVTSEKGDIVETKHTEAVLGTCSYDTRLFDLNILVVASTQAQSDETGVSSDEPAIEQPQVAISELDLLAKDASPTADEEPNTDEQTISRPVSVLQPPRTNNESWDGLTVVELEGESVADRLKRQVDQYKNYMVSLYKELEEERNASATAANEAMAMITKLQEEKASLHMEALQYLRMMEEQAVFDMEALARANELLAEREKELQDLEYELEFYKENNSDEQPPPKHKETAAVDDQFAAHTVNNSGASSNSTVAKILDTGDRSKLICDLVSNFEESISYISQCLKKMEENLHRDDFNPNSDNMPNSLTSEMTELEENVPFSNGNHTRHNSFNGAFETEISKLRGRLEAFEKDCNFLKCTLDLLWNEKDGLEVVQEIAHRLQELREMELRKR